MVVSAVFSPDCASALTASTDFTAKLWNISTGECLQTFVGFAGHTDLVSSAGFSPGGASIFTASHDIEMNSVDLFDVFYDACVFFWFE